MSTAELELIEQSAAFLPQYGLVPIVFTVHERLVTTALSVGITGAALYSEAVESPYPKDYDALPGQRPTDWPKRFDVSKWRFAAAYLAGRHVGGAAVAMDAVEDATLWDIRVSPAHRRQGIGGTLLKFAEGHAAASGKLRMSVETQNINVAACRLYASHGYELGSINRCAYPELPDEVQLIWTKSLDRRGAKVAESEE